MGSDERASGRHQEQQGHLGKWDSTLVDFVVPLPPLKLGDVKAEAIAVGETVREPETERESPACCCCCGCPLNGLSNSTNSRSCQPPTKDPVDTPRTTRKKNIQKNKEERIKKERKNNNNTWQPNAKIYSELHSTMNSNPNKKILLVAIIWLIATEG